MTMSQHLHHSHLGVNRQETQESEILDHSIKTVQRSNASNTTQRRRPCQSFSDLSVTSSVHSRWSSASSVKSISTATTATTATASVNDAASSTSTSKSSTKLLRAETPSHLYSSRMRAPNRGGVGYLIPGINGVARCLADLPANNGEYLMKKSGSNTRSTQLDLSCHTVSGMLPETPVSLESNSRHRRSSSSSISFGSTEHVGGRFRRECARDLDALEQSLHSVQSDVVSTMRETRRIVLLQSYRRATIVFPQSPSSSSAEEDFERGKLDRIPTKSIDSWASSLQSRWEKYEETVDQNDVGTSWERRQALKAELREIESVVNRRQRDRRHRESSSSHHRRSRYIQSELGDADDDDSTRSLAQEAGLMLSSSHHPKTSRKDHREQFSRVVVPGPPKKQVASLPCAA